MASLNPSVAQVLDSRPTNTTIGDNNTTPDSDDEDALIAALEEENDSDTDLTTLRENRLDQLHQELTRARTQKAQGNGTYTELIDEKSVMDITTTNKLVVVHFFKPDFHRCAVIDRHLSALAPKHFDTRFIKINVENAPFLVTKLKVQVLPCVICFVDAVGVDRVIGFEGIGTFGGGDDFRTGELEDRLLRCGVLVRAKMGGDGEERARVNFQTGKKSIRDSRRDEDEDDDWD